MFFYLKVAKDESIKDEPFYKKYKCFLSTFLIKNQDNSVGDQNLGNLIMNNILE